MRFSARVTLWAVAALGLVLATTAPSAQTTRSFTIAVCDDEVSDCAPYVNGGFIVMDDLSEAVEEAVTRAAQEGGHYTVLVTDRAGAPWQDNITVPADADVSIIGVPTNEPWQVPVEPPNNTLPVISIDPADDPDAPTDRLVIEALTLTGGLRGVDILGASNATINRCQIIGNLDAGVRVGNAAGTSAPLLVNCAIAGNRAGVVAEKNGAGTARPEVLFSSILDNADHGVFVEGGSNASVRNSLIFRNGDGFGGTLGSLSTLDGGLVWEESLFISPASGPIMGGTVVTIEGAGFASGATDAEVFFGPPDAPGTAAAINFVTDDAIECVAPPAYAGAPGPVDVYVVRGDGPAAQSRARVDHAFTYVAGETPYVTRVDPGSGPVDGGNWVLVEGARFDRYCEVFFSEDENVGPGDREADRVRWLSSGRLRVQVPDSGQTGDLPVNVLVRNTPDGGPFDSNPGAPYEYRGAGGCEQPEIIQISPNFFRDLEGAAEGGPPAQPISITGYGFMTGAQVQIGDVYASYDRVTARVLENGATIDVIEDVRVPVAPSGAGGVYDVAVTNPCGLTDVLPDAFTYYPTGLETVDPGRFEWRPSNFRRYETDPAGPAGAFTFTGFGFDAEVDVLFGDPVVAANTIEDVGPEETLRQHQGHTQRTVDFLFPARPSSPAGAPAAFPQPFAAGTYHVPLVVDNSQGIEGRPSIDFADAETDFYWALESPAAGEPRYFEVTDPAAIAVSGTGPNGRPLLTAPVLNWTSDMRIEIGPSVVDAATISTAPSGAPGVTDVTFEAPEIDEELPGPYDLALVLPAGFAGNPFGRALYTIVEDVYTGVPLQQPALHAVDPATVPENGSVAVRVIGANLLGPPRPGQYYTRPVLVWQDAGEQELDVLDNGGSVTWGDASELAFTIDLTDTATHPALGDVPRDQAIAVRLRHWDVDAAAPVIAGGEILEFTLDRALTFTTAAPVITSVDVDGAPGVRSGPLGGGTPLRIQGQNFLPAGRDPIVLIGRAEATDLTVNGAGTEILAQTPPAPAGTAGSYPVRVVTVEPGGGASDIVREAVAPRDQWFRYYMDGAPRIERLLPNHATADPDDEERRYVVLEGTNFDDRLLVTFSGPAGDSAFQFYSQSPTSAIVVLPPAEDLLDAGDYVDGVGEVQVTAQNLPLEIDDDTVELTSNAVPFYFFNDGRGPIEPLTPDVAFNDVYLNVFDYIRVEPGTGSFSSDPLLAPDAPWVARVLASVEPDLMSPLRDSAAEIEVPPYTSLDFEAGRRPYPSLDRAPQGVGPVLGESDEGLFDVGADEVNVGEIGVTNIEWYVCNVAPRPTPELEAGELSVEVRLSTYAGQQAPEPLAYLVPQGFGLDWGGWPLEPQDFDIGAGIFFFTNTAPITTVAEDNDNDGAPSQGDRFADGHAQVVVDVGDVDISITGQAQTGRHFLIDTVPPMMRVAEGGQRADEFLSLGGGGGPFAAQGVAMGTASHPYSALPTTWLPADVSRAPSPPSAPFDLAGYIMPDPNVGEGARMFFNPASISNGYPETGLFVVTELLFEDPTVHEYYDLTPEAALDTDVSTGQTVRQPAGFTPGSDWVFERAGAAVQWEFIDGQYLADELGVAVFRSATLVNPGYDYDDPAGGIAEPRNKRLLTAWRFVEPDSGQWMIPLSLAEANDPLRVSAQFRAVDRAANRTRMADMFAPLEFRWMRETGAVIEENRENTVTQRPSFSWELARAEADLTVGEPDPIFCYRLWHSGEYNGVYEPIGDWSAWTPDTELPGSWFEQPGGVVENFRDRWILFVVVSGDEAGNIQPWPGGVTGDELIDCRIPEVRSHALAAANWQRFYLAGSSVADTLATPVFWHNNYTEGAPSIRIVDSDDPDEMRFLARLIPVPEDRQTYRVSAAFELDIPDLAALQAQQPMVFWELDRDGVQVANGVLDLNASGHDRLQLPLDFFTTRFEGTDSAIDFDESRLTDTLTTGQVRLDSWQAGRQPRTIEYVFRARAWVDENDDDIPDPNELDISPANAAFKVVPATSEEEYVEDRASEDLQPVKSVEDL